MRTFLVAALALWAGCETDACRGVDGTCVALTAGGEGSVDGLQIALSGAASGTQVAPRTAAIQTLPVEVALQLSNASSGTLHIDVVGLLLGGVVGGGSVDVDISAGAHVTARVELTPGGGGGGGSGGGDGGMVAFDVTGTRVRHYLVGDGGVTDVPTDFTGVPISAFVADADGGITTVAGSGDANGNFAIHKVPSAPYVLHFSSTYVYGSAKHPDLGAWILGRADQTAATSATTLSFSVTNLASTTAADTFEFFALNAGTAVFGVENLVPVGTGSTTFTGGFDLSRVVYGNLFDAAKGDDALLVQLVGDTNNGVPFDRLAKIANFPPVTVGNGGSASLSAAMTDVAQSGSLSINWTRSQFAQYRAAINPNATADYDAFYVYAQPGGLGHGSFSSTPDVLVVNPPTGATDVSLATTYGNPYPSSWPLVAAATTNVSVSYAAPGATSQSFDGAIFAAAPLATLPSPTVPVISPVQNPTIDGQNAFLGAPNLSATPVIAWAAPALGTASSYGVGIYAIDNVAGKTSLDSVATFYTTLTSVTVPPGLLAGGQGYFVDITAYADGVDRSVTPYADALPSAYADSLSASLVVGLVAEAASCKALLALHPGLPDGVYTIDVDGSGAAPPVAVFCDMTSDGGGWTLCAWSKDATTESATWAAASQAQSTNWYGCQKYSATPVEIRGRVANATTSYSNRYANVDLRPSVAMETLYTPAVAKSPNFTLDLLPNTAACGASSAGNFQWALSTTEVIYGQQPKNSCGSGGVSSLVRSSGVHSNGCSGTNQTPPEIGYPCGGDGNFGVHLELWAR